MRKPDRPPELHDVVRTASTDVLPTLIQVGPLSKGRYLSWEEVKHRKPPLGLTPEQWWVGMRLARSQIARPIPSPRVAWEGFTYSLVDPVLEKLHLIDQQAAGRLATPSAVLNPETRDRYVVHGLVEEAIASSQIEGAVMTRAMARAMIRERRRPTDHSEQMILNNYQAIQFIRDAVGEQLTEEVVLTLHRILTEGTLDDPTAAGRFQVPREKRVVVVDERDGTIVHTPPSASELPDRMEAMYRFANSDGEGFVHPLIRAIALHFWLAHDHPFVDGNGRTARALFYWSALRSGYWLTEFVSISRVILKAPIKYGRAFLHVETDHNDITYFLVHQLDVLQEAFNDLWTYVERKVGESRVAEKLTKRLPGLNHRQRALLGHALRNPGFRYTYQSHATSHGIVRQTSRADLVELGELGLIEPTKSGRRNEFIAPYDLTGRLEALNTADQTKPPEASSS